MNVSLPADSDGFLSQECPSCSHRFKVRFGEGSDQPISFCPYCGYEGQQCWWTEEQSEYFQRITFDTVVKPELDKLDKSLKSIGGLIDSSLDSNAEEPGAVPEEIDGEMQILRFRCCEESVKVERGSKHFCVICGKEFSMEASAAKKVFLSHKTIDKSLVYEYGDTLRELGYEPWLDEDAMPAGTSLEKGLLKGMEDSCGVVFFITPSFKDEGFLETEIEYAIIEKRKKRDGFAIITLQFSDSTGAVGDIPKLLKNYVWKKPKNDLAAVREIIKALPLQIQGVQWREGIEGVDVIEPKAKTKPLSDTAKEMLKAAAMGSGDMYHYRALDGSSISAGKTNFSGKTPRETASYESALEELQRRGLVKDRGHKGEVFRVTHEGYQVADAFVDPGVS